MQGKCLHLYAVFEPHTPDVSDPATFLGSAPTSPPCGNLLGASWPGSLYPARSPQSRWGWPSEVAERGCRHGETMGQGLRLLGCQFWPLVAPRGPPLLHLIAAYQTGRELGQDRSEPRQPREPGVESGCTIGPPEVPSLPTPPAWACPCPVKLKGFKCKYFSFIDASCPWSRLYRPISSPYLGLESLRGAVEGGGEGGTASGAASRPPPQF